MNKTKFLATVFAVAALSFTSAIAADVEMEKCTVNKTDVMVPKGECVKVQKGDLSNLSEEVKAQVEAAQSAR